MPFEYAGVALQQHLFTETIASLYRKVTITPCKKCGIYHAKTWDPMQ